MVTRTIFHSTNRDKELDCKLLAYYSYLDAFTIQSLKCEIIRIHMDSCCYLRYFNEK